MSVYEILPGHTLLLNDLSELADLLVQSNPKHQPSLHFGQRCLISPRHDRWFSEVDKNLPEFRDFIKNGLLILNISF